MGTVSEKLAYLNETKTAIKDAIITKGVEISDTDTFRSYATKIEEISGGGGTEIQVVNKTGAVVNEGDKLWVNENSYVAGQSLWKKAGASGSYGEYTGYIDTTGTFAVFYGSTYTVTVDDSGAPVMTAIGSAPFKPKTLHYGLNNEIFIADGSNFGRCDAKHIWSGTNGYLFLSNDNSLFGYSDNMLKEFNPDTGETIREISSWAYGYQWVKINEYFYGFNGNGRFKLNEDGSLEEGSYTQTGTVKSSYPFGITSDGKYILASSNQSNFNTSGYLRILEVVDENTIKFLPSSEFPEDLQAFASTTSVKFAFNHTNGILTCASKGNNITTMQYKNGVWTKIPIDFNLNASLNIVASITYSNDLTVASFGSYSSSASQYTVYFTQNIKQLAALPYKPSYISDKTLTVTAKTTANPDEVLTAITGGDVVLPEDTKWGATVTDLLGDVDESGNVICSGKIDLVIPENATTIPLSGLGLTKSLKSIDFSNVSVIDVTGLRRSFSGSNLETVDMSNVKQIKAYGMLGCFEYSEKLTSIRFDNLEAVYAQGLAYAFSNCSSLTSIAFPKLEWINTAGLGYAFRSTPITTLSFPSLVTFYTGNALADMGKECTTLSEIHFRADVQSKVEALTGYSSKFGAPSTCTIYFDL